MEKERKNNEKSKVKNNVKNTPELSEAELEKLDKKELISMFLAMQENLSLMTEEVRMMRSALFGRSTEKNLVDKDDQDGQLSFAFNEAEGTVDIIQGGEQEPPMEKVCPKTYMRRRQKKKKGRREEELSGIPVTVVEHTLTEEELLERFPSGNWGRLPDRVYRRLEFHPAYFEVIEYHIAVYAGGKGGGVVTADRPQDLFPNSIATPSLVAGILNYKYVNSQPINRIGQEFERNGVYIPRQNLCRWAVMSADRYLGRLYGRLKKELMGHHVIHADETPVEVRHDGRKAGAQSYMWVYRSGALEPNPLVLYDYQRTRNADHPREFLDGFKGYCVTDGYEAYHKLDREVDGITVAGCWAHARRKFSDVIKALPEDDKSKKDSVAYKALQLIKQMFEKEGKCSGMPPDGRLEMRKKDVAPLVDAFFAYIKSEQGKVPAKSGTGKAITYCLNQEKYLRVFLTDGCVPMENNAAERGIRTFCLGKKNWYLIDTVSGAQASAVLYSIAETARANDLKPYEYFKYLLEEIPKHGEFEDDGFLDALLPWSDQLPDTCRKPAANESPESTDPDSPKESDSPDAEADAEPGDSVPHDASNLASGSGN